MKFTTPPEEDGAAWLAMDGDLLVIVIAGVALLLFAVLLSGRRQRGRGGDGGADIDIGCDDSGDGGD